ncbi:MAG TPA: ADP-ribosylation family protein [Gemmataceae bacterium]|nr:ADP-ribosylation family protein [Gemmataceae bacterium]
MRDRRQQLRDLYGFDFPEDFFRFWEFVNRLQPLEPLKALLDLSIQLVGPFEILAGRFDNRTPRHSLLLHWRYSLDPPEFFTVLAGGGDGLHWGYYLDDPAAGRGCIASYYASDAFELSVDGDDLFEAVRLWLEEFQGDCELDYSYGSIEDPEYEQTLATISELRRSLLRYGTQKRRKVGAAYVDRYAGRAANRGAVVAETYENMGIGVPPANYRPLSRSDEELWPYLCGNDDPAVVVEEARKALRDGFPGTALKLGKDLWAIGGERHTAYAYELLDAAYAALGRDVLREVLRVHRANRDLPSVDILDNEG